jgi:UPF0755 protein
MSTPEPQKYISALFRRLTASVRVSLARSRTLVREARMYDRLLPTAFLLGVLAALVWYTVFAPPPEFEVPAVVKVADGVTLDEVTRQFADAHAVRYPAVLKALLRLGGANKRVQSGSYFFSSSQNVFTVARRLSRGDFELEPVRVTINERQDTQDIAILLKTKLAPFDEVAFLNAALPKEGYLYPDTYYFLPGQDPASVVAVLEKNFDVHVAPLVDKVRAFGQPLQSVVTMASILIGEANTDKDRRLVAGVLWKRLEIGMPLQVDATFGYILDKNLTRLSGADIRTESPYNTYRNKGLPPTPINNPTVAAIEDAVTPTKSNYLYYLSDRHGNMYFSTTYQQHLAKIRQFYR